MKNYIIEHYNNLYKYGKQIKKDYNNMDILNLSKKYDLSPVTIIKYLFESKYNHKINKIVKNTNILDERDKTQLDMAIANDNYFQFDQTNQQIDAISFEKKVEEFLIKNNIKYSTQEELSEEQIKDYGKPINTPDFLIKSELIVDDKKVNWIDAKNFYGANIRFIKNKIKKQIAKYIKEYGDGMIVFNLGHNDELKIDNVIFIGYEDLI